MDRIQLVILGIMSGAIACGVSPQASEPGNSGSTAPVTHRLTLNVKGGGTGSIHGAGIADCRANCTADLAASPRLALAAIADAGSSFAGWSGACEGAADCQVLLDADRSVTATFAPLLPPLPGKHALTVAKSGSGTVSSSPAGIDCGSACAATFDDGANVTLSAVPDPGFRFAGFSGTCSGAACALTMQADSLVQAAFEVETPPPPPPPPPPPNDDCAGLLPPPLPAPITRQLAKGPEAETLSCGPGTSDGHGNVALATLITPFDHDTVATFSASGALLGSATVNFTLSLFEQAEGFEGTDITGHTFQSAHDVIAIAPDGTVTRHGTGEGRLAVLDPLGGIVAVASKPSDLPNPVFLEAYDSHANLRWRVPAKGGIVGVDRLGNILILFLEGGSLKGQWADHDGNFDPVFEVGAAPGGSLFLQPRVGGGFFLNAYPGHWILQFESRSPTPSPPPAWLVARNSELFKIHMAFGGRAYAFIGQQDPASSCTNNIEIVAPSGKSCGRMEFPIAGSCKTAHLDIGYDGTVIEGFPPEATPVAPDGAKHCAWRWWPAVLGAR